VAVYDDYESPYFHHMGFEWEFAKRVLPSIEKAIRKYPGDPDTLVACGLGSIPWVVELGRRMRIPYVVVRKAGEVMSADKYSQVVGRFGPARRCLFVDDNVYLGRTQKRVKEQLELREATLVGTLQLENVALLPAAKKFFKRDDWEGAARSYIGNYLAGKATPVYDSRE
jgi:orotate phosphoribosyltransferase